MLSKDKRICPCCGKPLELIPPDEEHLPNSVGTSANGVGFCVVDSRRVFGYTKRPNGRMNGVKAIRDEYTGIDLNSRYHVAGNRRRAFRVRPIALVRDKIARGGVHLYEPNIYFLCANCGRKLALDKNPRRLSEFVGVYSAFLACAVIMLALLSLARLVSPLVLITVLAAGLGAALLFFACCGLNIRFIETHLNNLVPVDEYDSMVYPETHFALLTAKSSPYLREGNVFSTELDGEIFYVYLVRKKEVHEFHICGTEDEPERLLSLIREKQSRGEKVTLPLTFEGKAVGSAEFLETYGSSGQVNERRNR